MFDEMIKIKFINREDCLRHYELVRDLWESKEIREATWNDFCAVCLEELMEDNQNILRRLKNC